MEFEDRIEYRLNGELHRADGPAREWADEYKEWCVNGKRLRDNMKQLVHVYLLRRSAPRLAQRWALKCAIERRRRTASSLCASRKNGTNFVDY